MKVRINDCGQGVNKDLLSEELSLGVWSDVSNMRFQHGFAERFGGSVNIFDTPSVTPYFVMSFNTGATRFWVHAGLTKVFVDDGSTRTEITGPGLTGTVDDRWTGTVLNGVLVLNNGVNPPMYWGGDVSLNLATLPDWDPTWKCQSIRAYKGALVAVNITKGTTNYPSMVKTSSVADPGDIPLFWVPDPTNLAREFDLSETGDIGVDLLAMGDQMIVYKTSSMYAMTIGTADEVYRFQRLPGSDGLLSRGCEVDTPLGHVVLTSNDVVIHQGQGTASIADGVVKDYIFNSMNRTTPGRPFLCVNPPAFEVWICFPSEDSETCDMAVVWNWRSKVWGTRSLNNVTYGDSGQLDIESALFSWASNPYTWATAPGTWSDTDFSPNENRLLLSRVTALTAVDVATLELGSTMNAYLERTGIAFEDAGTKKYLMRSFWARFDAPPGTVIPIQAGSHNAPEEEPTWFSPVNFTVGVDTKVDLLTPDNTAGYYGAIRVGGNVDAIWKMRSGTLDMEPQGEF